ncbi:excitatory amino acid transporter 1-like isoform X2 [Mytilus californianus]|uniref:excitatory amino acid transporter 1-like isoform X2 n=1 Tax=Mytilus californianus TaxID=6549 RepID=UPI0022460AA8|nr:excitatory amino acid transporter 1-like isoform X2 [Mytilus californianus]
MAVGKEKCLEIVKANLLVLLTLVGAAVGFIIGVVVRNTNPTDSTLMWVGILGEIYLNMLKMMIVPLIVASVITGTATLDPKSNGKISLVSLGYIMSTNFLGCLVGSILCVIIRPGEIAKTEVKAFNSVPLETEDIFADLLRNIFPDNLISATFRKTITSYDTEKYKGNETINGTTVEVIKTMVTGKNLSSADSTNILGLLIASAVFGIATASTKEIGQPFFKFFYSATEIILVILGKLIWFTPIGVASLIGKTIGGTKNLEDDFNRLGLYIATQMIGYVLFMIVVVPITYFILMKMNPFKFLFTVIHAFVIVFATSMSAMSIPESIRQLEGPNKLDRRVTRFVIPLSAAIGRCGTCIYISISCLFVMQITDQEVDAASVILVIILTTFSSLAIPSVTGAGLITVIIILTALNITPEAAALLYTFEWILDRTRTITNYSVQVTCVVFTQRLCLSSLKTENNDDETSQALNEKENGIQIAEMVDNEEYFKENTFDQCL